MGRIKRMHGLVEWWWQMRNMQSCQKACFSTDDAESGHAPGRSGSASRTS